jgi:hypothetical protein
LASGLCPLTSILKSRDPKIKRKKKLKNKKNWLYFHLQLRDAEASIHLGPTETGNISIFS